ncbi:hypothetical protein DFH08DRAFT_1088238 [Mycena albidolilacea]|uniref:Uncharacterized protein n=1 Tax=Mycena albidolilacea TaxID=1033008 RepID=A0AAD6Z798_9AGAR|nr:hypothetical protein DFH08DRAFT_1088238 [Mycena albidolilacea]
MSAPGPAPEALAHLQAAEDEDAADLEGLAYARLRPREVVGKWEWNAVLTCGSATSSTLTSPRPTSTSFPHGVRDSDSPTEFGAFASGTEGVEDEFDGTPRGFGAGFGVGAEPEPEPEVPREALPSPGLSRGGFRFGGGAGKGMGGFEVSRRYLMTLAG